MRKYILLLLAIPTIALGAVGTARIWEMGTALFSHIATPSNPVSGKVKLYFKSDGKLYKLNSAGVESEVGAPVSGGSTLDLETKTANYNVTNAEDVILCNPAQDATITMTLQASASATLKLYFFKNIGSGMCIIDANSAETIEGDLDIALPAGGIPTNGVSIYPDGTSSWYIF